MEMTILYARFGEMEGRLWANAQTATDFDAEADFAGCQVGKIGIDTSDNCKIPRKLHRALLDAQAPIKIMAKTGSKTTGGKIVTVIKDFDLIPNK